MTRPPGSHLTRLWAYAAAALFAAACASSGPDVEGELDLPRGEVTQRSRKTERVTRLFTRKIQSLAADLEQIRQYGDLETDDLPRDLLRFVVVTCLNGEGALSQSDATAAASTTAPSSNFACPTPELPRLLDRLAELPSTRRERILSFLQTVDAFQQQRDRLQNRLQQVDRVVDSNRRLLAERRAELRNRIKRLEQRRSEFSSSEWNRLQSALDAYRASLERLKTSTDELDNRSGAWPERIETLNHAAYFAVIDPFRQ